MITFFYFKEDLNIKSAEFGYIQEHSFKKVSDHTKPDIDKVYFSTPSDFQMILQNIKSQLGEEKVKEMVFVIEENNVLKHKSFPKNIGFKKLEEEVEEFKEKKQLRLAITNAMSNALGDHLIGMNAFSIFQKKLKELLPETEIHITLYQLSPYRTGPITRKWLPEFQDVYVMPNKLSRLMECDAYVDLGALLLCEDFDKYPMIDFYLKSFSIDPDSVSDCEKRINYNLEELCLQKNTKLINRIKNYSNRPILLFHHKSTSHIRTIPDDIARDYVRKIVDNTEYFVISACGLEFEGRPGRFISLHNFSRDLDDYAAMIGIVDKIVTVDTSCYHFADAFDTPTVVLFTSIEPSLRVCYYPYVEGIMLEKEGGDFYGKHKFNRAEGSEYMKNMWNNFDMNILLEKL